MLVLGFEFGKELREHSRVDFAISVTLIKRHPEVAQGVHDEHKRKSRLQVGARLPANLPRKCPS